MRAISAALVSSQSSKWLVWPVGLIRTGKHSAACASSRWNDASRVAWSRVGTGWPCMNWTPSGAVIGKSIARSTGGRGVHPLDEPIARPPARFRCLPGLVAARSVTRCRFRTGTSRSATLGEQSRACRLKPRHRAHSRTPPRSGELWARPDYCALEVAASRKRSATARSWARRFAGAATQPPEYSNGNTSSRSVPSAAPNQPPASESSCAAAA
jgi:hypothetical protein